MKGVLASKWVNKKINILNNNKKPFSSLAAGLQLFPHFPLPRPSHGPIITQIALNQTRGKKSKASAWKTFRHTNHRAFICRVVNRGVLVNVLDGHPGKCTAQRNKKKLVKQKKLSEAAWMEQVSILRSTAFYFD